MIDPSEMVELTAIDMSLPEEEIVPQFMHSLNTAGFVLLKNVQEFDEASLFKAVKAFYTDVPASERRKLVWRNHCPENSNYYRGLTPFVDNDPAHKEIGRQI